MNLNELATVPITRNFVTGNDFLLSIITSIYEYYKGNEEEENRIIGIGLLFHEDVQPSDCNVIYSTSLSSANISLKEALLTQFRVLVTEEYMSELSILQLINEGENKSLNNAHISIGNNILASVTIDGKPLKLKGGRFSDITPLILNTDDVKQLNMLEELYLKESQHKEKEEEHIIVPLSKKIANAIVLLCTLFSLDTIYLSGVITKSKRFMRTIREMISSGVTSASAPDVEVLNTIQQPITELLARKVRYSVLDHISI